jgi:RNA polymerase sigma factor (sigma-70 family)
MTAPIDRLEPLVASAAGGDTDAFNQILVATSGMVASIVLAIVRDVDMSQDIAQEVFLSAWRDLKKLRNSASFLPWLRQVARNRAHHALRTRIRRRRWLVPFSGQEERLEAMADPNAGATARLLNAEQRHALRSALGSLPDDTREALILFYREGQSVAQVAALLDLSEDAVKKRLSRARTALRGMILDQLGDSLKRTVPGSAFTIAVMAALPLSMPMSASAAAVSAKMTPAATSTGLWPWLLWVTAPFAGAVLGLIAGVGTILQQSRKRWALARDARERRELRLMTAAQIAGTLAFLVAMQVSVFREGIWLPIGGFLLFSVVLTGSLLWWLPRISARRLAAEILEDPVHAPEQHRRDRRRAVLWSIIGQLLGWSTLFIALRLAHKL